MFPTLTPERAFDRAARAAAVTHGHPSGYLSAGALAGVIRLCLDGTDLASAGHAVIGMLGEMTGADETASVLSHALQLAGRDGADHTIAALGEGWVGEEAEAIGLYAALVATSFPDVIRIAANHGGDSDSTASIAGQLYGAWKGADELPHRWLRRLDALEPLLSLIGQLTTKGANANTGNHIEKPPPSKTRRRAGEPF